MARVGRTDDAGATAQNVVVVVVVVHHGALFVGSRVTQPMSAGPAVIANGAGTVASAGIGSGTAVSRVRAISFSGRTSPTKVRTLHIERSNHLPLFTTITKIMMDPLPLG